MVKSKFIEENILHHFFNFWNQPTTENSSSVNPSQKFIGPDSVFHFWGKLIFKGLFLDAFKCSILNKKYSKEFIDEMKKKSFQKNLKNC